MTRVRVPGEQTVQGGDVTVQPVLAADVGGTQMRAALVDPAGNVLMRRSAPTPAEAHVPGALIDLLRAVGAENGHESPSHAVVGLPGAVDYDAGRLLWAPHLPESWPHQLSRAALTQQLGLAAHIANDADLAAVGEAFFGAGAGSTDVAYLTISTGIGAGVVHGGRVLHGRRSLAEVGHTIIDWRAWQEGRPSTLEDLGSGSGLARLALEQGLGALSARGVARAAAEGDAAASAVWGSAIAACAVGVGNLIMAFYPSTVVIGGGIGRRDDFFAPLRDLVQRRAQHFPADLSIVPSQLDDDAGLVGGAAWTAAAKP
jgi:glucokinase